MKNHPSIKIKLTVFCLIVISSFGYSQRVKQVIDFKTVKKEINTLSIFPTLTQIQVINVGDKVTEDSLFSEQVSDSISNCISYLLKDKFSIENLQNNYPDTTVEKLGKDLSELLYSLDLSDKQLSNVNIPTSITEFAKSSNSRFCIFTFYGGVYKTAEKIKQEERELLKKNIAISILTLGSVYITSGYNAISAMKTIVYDKETNRVLFYLSNTQLGLSPNSLANVKQFVLMNYKKLYYM
jgi:hypothetical protein